MYKRLPRGTNKGNKKRKICNTRRNKNLQKNGGVGSLTTPVLPYSAAEAISHSPRLKAAATKVSAFMSQKKHKITATFLKHICSDSGVCIAFGSESDKIKRFFNNFTNFDYAVNRKIINIGGNGVVYKIEYKHQNYLAHAILKSSIGTNSDNLMYEYKVGQTVNRFNKYFPCFVETYGVYKYNTDAEWKTSQNGKNVNKLQNILTQYPTIDYKDSCTNSQYLCILIQHIKDAPTLDICLRPIIFRQNDLLYCLYQVYYTLSMLSDEFTHYDLHTSNVLLYKPVNGKYIQYHYHLPDGTVVSFKSVYIVKLIDYGRSYVNGSMEDYEEICRIKECEPSCGSNVGYGYLNPAYDNNHINSSLSSKSHDLRLLSQLRQTFVSDELKQIIDKVVYNRMYGTPSNPIMGYPNRINNVMDAERLLRDMVLDPYEIQQNTVYHNTSTKLGDLHVHGLLQEMEYIPA
jgi:mRNA-degrading endonuclease HigB of HigAB toxin-antitoxin module